MEKAKSELIDKWYDKAERDLITATLIATQITNFNDIVGFHCQQCAEKYIKAYLVFLDIAVPKTHDLERLLFLLEPYTNIPASVYQAAVYIDDFSVEVRYPLGRVEVLRK
jgi:HEPN domain-containing protein